MKILFLGGGNMANALIGGMLDKGVPAGDLNRCLVTAMPSVQEAVSAALAKHGAGSRIIAIPSGPYCIPTPREG